MSYEEIKVKFKQLGIEVIEGDEVGIARCKRFEKSLGWDGRPTLGEWGGYGLWIYDGKVYVERRKNG